MTPAVNLAAATAKIVRSLARFTAATSYAVNFAGREPATVQKNLRPRYPWPSGSRGHRFGLR